MKESRKFQLDDIGKAPITENELLKMAEVNQQEITFMAVPLGSGRRMGVDSDDDRVLNANDNCPVTRNINQEDQDGNGIGDACH